MVERRFAITLEGIVSLARLTSVLSAWNESLTAISQRIGKEHVISIQIAALSYGSAVTETAVSFDQEHAANEFTAEHDGFSRALRAGTITDLPAPLPKPGKRLLSAASLDGAEEFVMSSDTGDFVINLDHAPPVPPLQPTQDQVTAYGGVIGVLQSLSSRGGLRAVVWDELNDKAVRCFISPHQHDTVGELWDSLVEVRGMVSRDPISGRPLSVREVDSIEPVDESEHRASDKSAWMQARGVLKDVHPELSSAELIRMVRNG